MSCSVAISVSRYTACDTMEKTMRTFHVTRRGLCMSVSLAVSASLRVSVSVSASVSVSVMKCALEGDYDC